jgi:basic membrane protein A
MPGYAFAGTVYDIVGDYPDVKFVALDVSAGDLSFELTEDWTLPANVFCAVYQEELAGYMAGYLAVKEGYTHLGFLGGMAVPAVIRYGFGFVQGANDAAKELNKAITIEYIYGGQFYGDASITAVMDTWYQEKGVEVVFACGGGIYTSAAEAAKKVNKKIIGVDVDQAATIDGTYSAGMTVTSAMKGLGATVQSVLEIIICNKWNTIGGSISTLGLVSKTDVTKNFVQLPYETTVWTSTFSKEDYKALVGKLFDKTVTVKNDTAAMPAVDPLVKVNTYDNIK